MLASSPDAILRIHERAVMSVTTQQARYSALLCRDNARSHRLWPMLVADTLQMSPWLALVTFARRQGHEWSPQALADLRDAHRDLARGAA